MISVSSIILSLALAGSTLAQSIPASASAQQLAIVAGQYNASRYPEVSNVGLGVPLNNPQALVTVVYPSGEIVNGQAYQASAVNTQPRVYLTPASNVASSFGTSNQFTLVLADAGAIGSPDSRAPNGNYRHYLANGIPGAAGTGGNTTFALSGGNVASPYAGPGPAAGEGPHRYAWLVFAQGSDFTAPTLAPQSDTSAWNVSQYVQEAKLGNLVGAAFFTVANGEASYSVAPTSAVTSIASSLYPTAGASSSGSARPSGSAAPSGSGTGAASIGKVVSVGGLALGAVMAVAAAYL